MQVDFYQLGRTPARAGDLQHRAKAPRRREAAADRCRGRRPAWRGSTACSGTRGRPASCRTAPAGGSDDARQPILLSTSTDAPNLARNMLIADGEWREAALTFDRAFHSVRCRHAGRRAPGLEAACRTRGRGAPLLGAGRRRAMGPEELTLAAQAASRLGAAANPSPLLQETARPWPLRAPFRSSSPMPPAAT